MKKLCEKISSNGRQILEIVALIIVTSIPWVVDLQEIFKEYLADHPISPDDFFWQVAFRMGKPVASVVLFFAVLIGIRKFNQGFVMNRKRVYHDYCYAWYWFCAKILGIKSCDLVLVPIHMQFKLVIRATFQEYPLDETDYHDVKVIDTRSRMMDFSGEVNVTTDADEMEDLYNRAKNLPDGDDKIILLKKAFELYRGRLFIQGEDDIGTWLYTYTTHYNQVYVDLTSALLTTLGHIRDYRCIMDYGPRALEIEPGILTAYYWIIIAADETGNSTAREKFLQKASEDLIDEENEKLLKLLAVQNHMS